VGVAVAGQSLSPHFYLLLLRLPARGRLKASPTALESLHLAAAVVFLTIAIPLKAQGRWLTVGWLAEGAALLWVAERVKSRLLRRAGAGLPGAGIGCVAGGEYVGIPQRQSSMRDLEAIAWGFAVFAFAAWLARRPPRDRTRSLR